jgi:hypothetical protein
VLAHRRERATQVLKHPVRPTAYARRRALRSEAIEEKMVVVMITRERLMLRGGIAATGNPDGGDHDDEGPFTGMMDNRSALTSGYRG